MNAIAQMVQTKGVSVDALCDALNFSRATYYRQQGLKNSDLEPKEPIAMPQNALHDDERQAVLDLMHSERFIDKTPYDVYYTLLDEGSYYCSPRTMYRLLESKGENVDRRNQRVHRDAVKPELIAERPNEVWSWDITKLLSTQRLVYYYLYVILDIFSRHVVGWLIADAECKELARKLIQETALKQGIQRNQLTLHADNGASMTSHTVAQLLEHLGILKTHNRPYTSNDNPFSESQFKTLKYCPEFPGRFDSLKDAEMFCRKFFNWYNKEHYHSGIAWLTPESVHYGQAKTILHQRHETLMSIYNKDPVRFNCKPPKRRQLDEAVYINPPQIISISALQEEASMA